jgi:protein-disulfide isomerase
MQKLKRRFARVAVLALLSGSVVLSAQFLGTSPANNLRDVAAIKLPSGSKVAIVVFEDLGCPACAHAHAIEIDAAKRANVPLLRYDFPFPGHIWTFQGAVCARYIQEKINPQLANDFRSDVFAAQSRIASKDDLQQFTQRWMQQHNQKMPFVMDPDGSLAKEVQADYDLGLHIKVGYTPTVIVMTKDQHQVVCGTKDGPNDPSSILPVVQAALTTTRNSRSSSIRSASPSNQ